jgi:hypothetical protein
MLLHYASIFYGPSTRLVDKNEAKLVVVTVPGIQTHHFTVKQQWESEK